TSLSARSISASRSRPELVPVLERALGADRDAEIRRALGDVVAIAHDRFRRAAGAMEVSR
ncbi:MAG TPA: hypothetical protein VHM48_09725, partial [Candidatus Limnocylindrales bacterium]|nr:hypothetical protein [Candidatus Limnocylindrales bacterium]